MKKKYASPKQKQRAYMERKREKKELAAEQADELARIKERNLCSFAEIGFETPASSCHEEIQVHRSWLRALSQPDVLTGESLRDLARRTWDALLISSDLGVTTHGGGKWVEGRWVQGSDVWYPYFEPGRQDFQRWFGGVIHGAAKSDWFDAHWVPPRDCSGNEPIDLKSLPSLPPLRKLRNFKP